VFVLADVMNGVFALLGVLLGSLLASVWSYMNERRGNRASLYVAAYSCLTRWRKVELAHDAKSDSIENEVTHLGRDLDKYMVAIPRVHGRRERNRHEAIYTRMVNIFSRQDLMLPLSADDKSEIRDAVESVAEEIRREFGRRSFPARFFRLGPGTAQRVVEEREKTAAQ
jgi:hypothetical protein